jgi:hypothetical protein
MKQEEIYMEQSKFVNDSFNISFGFDTHRNYCYYYFSNPNFPFLKSVLELLSQLTLIDCMFHGFPEIAVAVAVFGVFSVGEERFCGKNKISKLTFLGSKLEREVRSSW